MVDYIVQRSVIKLPIDSDFLYTRIIRVGNVDDQIRNFNFLVSIYVQKVNLIVLFSILSSEEQIGHVPVFNALGQTQ